MAYAVSLLHSLIRGSTGGLTYFSNQFHQICVRARTSPVQPNTPFQSGIKTAFDYADSQWTALSDADRALWENYAATCVYQGPAGPYTVPARQLFIGTLGLANYINGVFPAFFLRTTIPPLVNGFYNPGPFTVESYSGGSQGIDLGVFTPADEWSVIVVDTSIGFDATRLRYKGPWVSSRKYIQLLPPSAANAVSVDLPIGLVGKTIFSRSRVFTATGAADVAIPHRMAVPVILRHVCETSGNNGLRGLVGADKRRITPLAKPKAKTKKKAA